MLRNRAISESSFQTVERRSFLLILLDLCERFALYSCIPPIIRIIQRNNISINKRMSAALRYLYPSPSSNDELLDRFDDVCALLDEAITEEEDDASKSLITFLNYYAHVVYDTNSIYATRVKEQLRSTISSDRYSWLKQIKDISNLDVSDSNSVFRIIENKIDAISSRQSLNAYNGAYEELLVEENTDYSQELNGVPNNFLSVRQISVQHANGCLSGRGVLQLESEADMFEYFKRFGKMHYAKLLSSFESIFPQNFNEQVNIIDWGCGQGLASMTFIEKYGASSIRSITLIEPSELVIRRAALHCRKFAPNVPIHTVCKKLDEIQETNINTHSNAPTVHLFSNILDIDDYSTGRLLNLLDRTLASISYFVCVSPYIDDIKTARLDSFMKHFSTCETFRLYHNIENTKYGDYWLCNNLFQRNHISHGDRPSCGNYDFSGCSNKWTRVLRVFSV